MNNISCNSLYKQQYINKRVCSLSVNRIVLVLCIARKMPVHTKQPTNVTIPLHMHTFARLYPIKRASVCIVPKSRMYYSTKFPFYVCCSVCVTYGNGFGVIMPHWKQYRISPACNWLLANVLCLCIARIDVYVHSISCLTVMPQRL